MMKKILSTGGLMILMLVLIVGTVAAQGGVEPTATQTATPTVQTGGSTGYQHPVIQILSAYFGRITRPILPTATPTLTKSPAEPPTAGPSPTATATTTATPMPGPDEFAEEIAKYHADGMGFGVLVKLYAMAEASVKACLTPTVVNEAVTSTPTACTGVTVDQLVNEFKNGTGMGQLFKEYGGKPALLGVGQVRKALQKEPTATATPNPVLNSTPVPTQGGASLQSQNQAPKSNNGNGQGNKPVKVKPLKAQGSKK